jgi:hypothetical protein
MHGPGATPAFSAFVGGRDLINDRCFAAGLFRGALVSCVLSSGVDAPGALRVVTSDAELARRVRDAGAEVVGARWLLDQLG